MVHTEKSVGGISFWTFFETLFIKDKVVDWTIKNASAVFYNNVVTWGTFIETFESICVFDQFAILRAVANCALEPRTVMGRNNIWSRYIAVINAII